MEICIIFEGAGLHLSVKAENCPKIFDKSMGELGNLQHQFQTTPGQGCFFNFWSKLPQNQRDSKK